MDYTERSLASGHRGLALRAGAILDPDGSSAASAIPSMNRRRIDRDGVPAASGLADVTSVSTSKSPASMSRSPARPIDGALCSTGKNEPDPIPLENLGFNFCTRGRDRK
ncbi:hypothetical protein [Luteimonas sp. J16]|uniref:hypothetical protein n=2 Tax=unclassified Luteimonas TaxID=2629088 RepID=UPI0012EB40EC|nr:hypothetical protein [Luteimonas sp. J16]